MCRLFMCATPCICVPVFVAVCSADDLCQRWHQVKVMTEDELLGYACEQFLGKSVTEIKSVILQTLEGHLRAILGESFLQTALSQLDLFVVVVVVGGVIVLVFPTNVDSLCSLCLYYRKVEKEKD